MSLKSLLIRNACSNWLSYAIRMIVTFYTAPKIIHALGNQQNGIWNLVEGIIGYFALLDLGMATTITRFTARYQTQKAWDDLNRLLSSCSAILYCGSLVVTAGILCLAFGTDTPLGVTTQSSDDVRWLLLICGFGLVVLLSTEVYGAILLGMSKFPVYNGLKILGSIAWGIAVVVHIRRGCGLIDLVATKVGIDFLVQVLMFQQARSRLPQFRISLALVDRQSFNDVVQFGGSAFLIMIAGAIGNHSNPILINYFMTPEFITFFIIGYRLVDYSKSFFQSLYFVLTPVFSSLDAQNETGKIRDIMFTATRYLVYLVVPLEAGLIVLGKPFISIWMSPAHAEMSYPVLLVLSIPMVMQVSQNVVVKVLYGTGKLKWLTWLALGQSCTSIGISFVLIPRYGIVGCAWGMTISILISTTTLCVYTCRQYSISPASYLARTMIKPCASLPLALGTWWCMMKWFPIDRWSHFLIVGASGTLVYGIISILLEWGAMRTLRIFQKYIPFLTRMNVKNAVIDK